jgi:hypothetical protein
MPQINHANYIGDRREEVPDHLNFELSTAVLEVRCWSNKEPAESTVSLWLKRRKAMLMTTVVEHNLYLASNWPRLLVRLRVAEHAGVLRQRKLDQRLHVQAVWRAARVRRAAEARQAAPCAGGRAGSGLDKAALLVVVDEEESDELKSGGVEESKNVESDDDDMFENEGKFSSSSSGPSERKQRGDE